MQEKVGSGSWSAVYTGSAVSKAISGKSNAAYGYRVQACNVGGCGPWSNTKTTTVLLTPTVPASITVPSTSSGSIPVSWASSALATSYTLQQRLGTGSWSTVYTGTATSSTRTVTTSGSYTFQVKACIGSVCSAYRASSPVVVTIPPASAPTLTVPTTSGSGSYTASWTAVTGATSYTLQERVGTGSWSTIQNSSARTKAISGKSNGSYGYRVQACNTGGCGAWSSTKTITVALVPAVPSSLNVSSTGLPGRPIVHVTWNAASRATSYQLQGDHPQDGTSIYYDGPNTSFSQLILGTNDMYFRVRACNAAGCSAWSADSIFPLHLVGGDPPATESVGGQGAETESAP